MKQKYGHNYIPYFLLWLENMLTPSENDKLENAPTGVLKWLLFTHKHQFLDLLVITYVSWDGVKQSCSVGGGKWRMKKSNQKPPAYKADALPTEIITL